MPRAEVSRRDCLGLLGATVAAGAMAEACRESAAHAATVDLPKPIELPSWLAPSERQENRMPNTAPTDRRYGVALVGLGRLAMQEILPALAQSRFVKVTALVSGNAAKARQLAAQYGVRGENVFDYAGFDRIAHAADVDFVYVLLPNSMHHEFVLRAAAAGKHVLCEKPMANSVREAEEMVAACAKAGRKLMIAYRMQYAPMHRELIRRVRGGELGKPRLIVAHNGQASGNEPNDWRLSKALAGGGSLPDIGLYCLNAARYLLGEEPTEVSCTMDAPAGDPRFREVEDTTLFTLRFPSGALANLSTSYSSHEARVLRLLGSEAWAALDPAFAYRGLRMRVGRKAKGANHEELTEITIEEKNQFALELDHFAECIANDRRPHTPGEEGLQDQRIMEALYVAAREGRRVQLPAVTGLDAFRGPPPLS